MTRPWIYCIGVSLVLCLTATLVGEPEAQVRRSADAVAAVVTETAAPGVSRAEQDSPPRSFRTFAG